MLRNEKGATAVEFALVFPLFITLLFGIIEFAVILYDKALVTHAAREAARACVMYTLPPEGGDNILPTKQNFEDAVHNFLGFDAETKSSMLISLGGAGSTEPIIFPNPGTESGDFSSVTVSYSYTFLMIPNFIPGLANTLTLSSTATMRTE